MDAHYKAIDQCISVTRFPSEIKEALKSFYRTRRLGEWLFYTNHIEMLIVQYKVTAPFYWSSDDRINSFEEMYHYHDLGLYEDSDTEEEEVSVAIVPSITVTLY